MVINILQGAGRPRADRHSAARPRPMQVGRQKAATGVLGAAFNAAGNLASTAGYYSTGK